MRADGVAGGRHLLEDFGLLDRMLADREEDRLGAVRGERGQHRRRIHRPRAVVEGEHDFAGAQEVMALKCSKPKPGPPVVSISTTRLTPIAFGLAQVDWHRRRRWRHLGGDYRRCTAASGVRGRMRRMRHGCPPRRARAPDPGYGGLLSKKIAPKIAAQTMIASADAIAATRMSDLQVWDAAALGRRIFFPPSWPIQATLALAIGLGSGW